MRVMADSGPTTMTGLRSGSSQVSTSRIVACGMAMHPAVTYPLVTCRKMPDTFPGIRCGFTAMLTA